MYQQLREKPDQRNNPRYITLIQSRLLWDGMSHPATIQNISMYGALLHCKCLPTVGSRVSVIAEGLEIVGTAIWTGPDRCGVLFNRAVEPLSVITERPIKTRDPVPMRRIVQR
ncbi:PilZ domain-containing protein [Sphingobium sp. AN641]|uniref:PilZ domain-containing protein n=1 Tax=Sphingobium sp. AN641 TaxID=3133443 RepID=UPI0030C11C3D